MSSWVTLAALFLGIMRKNRQTDTQTDRQTDRQTEVKPYPGDYRWPGSQWRQLLPCCCWISLTSHQTFTRIPSLLLPWSSGTIYHLLLHKIPSTLLQNLPLKAIGTLCCRRCRHVGKYIGILILQLCLWTTSWRQFKSDCHRTWSVILLATGDEVIKFWKVKVKGQGRWGRYALYWALLDT